MTGQVQYHQYIFYKQQLNTDTYPSIMVHQNPRLTSKITMKQTNKHYPYHPVTPHTTAFLHVPPAGEAAPLHPHSLPHLRLPPRWPAPGLSPTRWCCPPSPPPPSWWSCGGLHQKSCLYGWAQNYQHQHSSIAPQFRLSLQFKFIKVVHLLFGKFMTDTCSCLPTALHHHLLVTCNII